MQISKYLIVNSRGNVTMRERPPRLQGNEIAVLLTLAVPDAIFKRPTLEARMVVPNEAVPKATITPKVTDNIEKIIKEATGLNMVVTVMEQEQDEKLS